MIAPREINHTDIYDQRVWSDSTFGRGPRTEGVLRHIEKELAEVRADPDDIYEWADLLILVLDGATRRGFSGAEIIHAYHDKMRVNRGREWPDFREYPEDQPIEHVR